MRNSGMKTSVFILVHYRTFQPRNQTVKCSDSEKTFQGDRDPGRLGESKSVKYKPPSR